MMSELEEVRDYVRHYDVTPERNEYCREAALALFNDYKDGIIDKPSLLRQLSEQAETKYEAAMMSLFLGYMLHAEGVE